MKDKDYHQETSHIPRYEQSNLYISKLEESSRKSERPDVRGLQVMCEGSNITNGVLLSTD